MATKAKKKAKSNKTGNLSIAQMKNLVNKNSEYGETAFDLNQSNPTEVTDWIPTGSRWLDSIICRGKLTGIPTGKIVEIAGLESSGKSFMAAVIAAHAQKLGIMVVYLDSESALDPAFLKLAGVDLDKILYVQAANVEFVLETIEQLLGANEQRMLFIWDSIAFTPTCSDLEGDMNPQSTMAMKARVLGKGLPKLVQPIANGNHTFLCLNQLKVNISTNPFDMLVEPFFTPGGKALTYAYSLRIWLTARKGKKTFLLDDKGFKIGSQVAIRLKKSRFGSEGRQCTFKILWGADDVGVRDRESWFEAIQTSDKIKRVNGWNTIIENDKEYKWQDPSWLEKLEDDEFRNVVTKIMDEEIIRKFDERSGNASDFYEVFEEEDPKKLKD